ncbi:MAG: GAF domain-containing protein [Bryobacteraceae bacterium]|nr:response regulator [Bryobacterales bacterium]NUN03377.1 GAF domain-containing protein [Bryobacteraceae bacterium]
MASRTRVHLIRSAAVAGCLLLSCAALVAQQQISIREAASRRPSDFAPVHQGKDVLVTGTVTGKAISLLDYAHLGITDGEGHGLTIEDYYDQLVKFEPGDRLQVQGRIGKRGGVPVVRPTEIRLISHTEPPAAYDVTTEELNSPRYLGLWVTTQAEVIEVGEDASGDYLVVGDPGSMVKVFLPKRNHNDYNSLAQFAPRDRVRITGLASQYCPIPPYDRMFQVLVAGADSVVLVNRRWLIPPGILLLSVVLLVAALGVWLYRERRVREHRENIRALHGLAESVIAAGSPSEILDRLRAALPRIFGMTGVTYYIYREAERTMERVASPETAIPPFFLDSPPDPITGGAAICIRNRTLLVVPETHKSPFFSSSEQDLLPRSVIFVPMFWQSELMGVLQLQHDTEARSFNIDQQTAVQHLANQIATSLKLLEQRSIREQLFRSEKLAASGQLISGVAAELGAPIDGIVTAAGQLLSRSTDKRLRRDLSIIAEQARKASEIVTRLVSFANADKTQPKPIDVNSILAGLIDFREREWKLKEIELVNRVSADRMYVTAAQGQLEQVFLSLILRAEQALGDAAERRLSLASSELAGRVVVEIAFTAPKPTEAIDMLNPNPDGAAGVDVSRAIIRAYGGELRSGGSRKGQKFEVELPAARQREVVSGAGEEAPAVSERSLTALLVEPDPIVRRQLLLMVTARGHRVVPVAQAEQAVEMVPRLRFDVVFCSVRLPGLNWVEFFERARHLVGCFVLVTEGSDPELSRTFESGDGYVLTKPINDGEVKTLLSTIARRDLKREAKPAG